MRTLYYLQILAVFTLILLLSAYTQHSFAFSKDHSTDISSNETTDTINMENQLSETQNSIVTLNDNKKYDSINTLLALNNCIVSIAKIISYNDRIILDQEYSDIINNINFGNIESDPELIVLYRFLMEEITNAKLRDEEKQRYFRTYNKKIKRSLYDSLSGISIQGLNPASLIINGITNIGL